jgi:hypothetical protein
LVEVKFAEENGIIALVTDEVPLYDIKIRRLGWAGNIVRMKNERIPKTRFLVGNFLSQDQWENQERDGRTSSGGTQHRS